MWKHKNFINLQLCATFKHFYDAGTIGSGTVKFRHYSQQEPTPPTPVYTDCLTFTGEDSEFTLKATNKSWDGTLQWSTDHTNWTTLSGTEAMQSVGKKLYLRGKGNTSFGKGNSDGVLWQLSAKAGCSGNIQTLLDWENPPTAITGNRCYVCMFYNCVNLTKAPELPATTLGEVCYSSMFQGCINLRTAPKLPATTLVYGCYGEMFKGCSKLNVNSTSGNKIFTCPSDIPDYAVDEMFTGTYGLEGTPEADTTYYWEEIIPEILEAGTYQFINDGLIIESSYKDSGTIDWIGDFTCNNVRYSGITVNSETAAIRYLKDNGESVEVFTDSSWVLDTYRTITFENNVEYLELDFIGVAVTNEILVKQVTT